MENLDDDAPAPVHGRADSLGEALIPSELCAGDSSRKETFAALLVVEHRREHLEKLPAIFDAF